MISECLAQALADHCGLRYVLTNGSGEGLDARHGRVGTIEATIAGLSDGWGPELLGLLEGLPHLLPRDADFDPALCVLLPPSIRARWAIEPIVPWGFEDG